MGRLRDQIYARQTANRHRARPRPERPPVLEEQPHEQVVCATEPAEAEEWVDCTFRIQLSDGRVHEVPLRHPKDPSLWSGDLTTMEHSCGIRWDKTLVGRRRR